MGYIPKLLPILRNQLPPTIPNIIKNGSANNSVAKTQLVVGVAVLIEVSTIPPTLIQPRPVPPALRTLAPELLELTRLPATAMMPILRRLIPLAAL